MMLQPQINSAKIAPMNDIGVIHLSNGGFTVVDADRVEELSTFKWRRGAYDYIVTTDPGRSRHIRLHRMLLKAPAGVNVDHQNRVKLDNRVCNLRLANESQNGANSGKRANASSRYKGVSWDKRNGKWHVMIKVNYKAINLGHFVSEVDGAKAYNAAAVKHFGEFARLNELP